MSDDAARAAVLADSELLTARESCSKAFLACLRGAVDAPARVRDALAAVDRARQQLHGMAEADADPVPRAANTKPASHLAPADFHDAGLDATKCPECNSKSEVTNSAAGVRCRACLACGAKWNTAETPTERTVRR